jgi:hypothetical protein
MTGVGRETLLESAGTTFLKQNHKSRELRMLRLHLANMTIMQPVHVQAGAICIGLPFYSP